MLAAAENKTGTTTFTTPSDREVVVTRVFDAPRHLVFEARTHAKHVRQWMVGPSGWTMPICESDVRPGGAWRAVWKGPNGNEMELSGVYQEVVPPERFVRTEIFRGMGKEFETLNTVVLSEANGKTTLTFTLLYPSKEARDQALKSGMKEGMSGSFDQLAAYLQKMA